MAKKVALILIEQVIADTGSTEPAVVSLHLETLMRQRMANWKTKDIAFLYQKLKIYGIAKYSDVVKLINQARRAV